MNQGDDVTPDELAVAPSRGFTWGIKRFLFWSVVILGTTMLGAFLTGDSGRQSRPVAYYWCQFLILLPLVVVSWASWRHGGATWDWLFALLVSIHAIVLQLFLTFDLWQPKLPSLKGFFLGLFLVLPVLGFALIRRIVQRRASFALTLFFLFTISQVVVTSLFMQGKWHRDAKGSTHSFTIPDHRPPMLTKDRLVQL
ncbi:MAG TPA: hypothetical protein DCE55_03465 [Planctomycetaceae bacterium]|jgi:hypothetical protein|nr:hypothetical protein [Planctomycetaceae bacterium]|tara:strand:- start:2196 stop:2786 length:591 start_codon:yes stop_codon:yes gene_type:complete